MRLPSVNMAARPLAVLVLALVGLLSCARQSGDQQYLARVDDARLTREEVSGAMDTSARGTQPVQAYVNDWVVTELLYQEAARRGLAETDEIHRQLEDTKKRLAVAALLDKELYSASDTVALPDGACRAYLDSSGNEFKLRSDVLLASYALFAERDAANMFRSWLLGGTPWTNALAEAQHDSALTLQLKRVITRQYCTAETLYPQELWKLARTLRKDEVSFALKTPAGYYVIQVHGIKHQGEVPDLDYVRPEIRERLLLEQRRARYDRLLEDLRARHIVEVHVPALTNQ